jgi:hypothetical protein
LGSSGETAGLPGAVIVRRAGKKFCGGVSPERPSRKKQGRVRKGKLETRKMLTGTLIEDLMTAVERVERKAQAEEALMAVIEPWFVSVQGSVICDNELAGVA